MTALNWELSDESVMIFSDTLMLSGETHRPLSFTTKVFPLPHLDLCIAGTGVQQLVQHFWSATNSGMAVSDIDHDLLPFESAVVSSLCSVFGPLLTVGD
ncbi:hypothetical protein, partial [Phaeobacter gallaeciensis]|uniref:hypothetical protein n=1 Tax=Phaeobacter gallaeciensis TaxID=60890 RepID=UPI00237FD686